MRKYIGNKIQEIGKKGEKDMKDYLSKSNKYIIFDNEEITKLLIKYGKNLGIEKEMKKLKAEEKLKFFENAIKEAKKKYNVLLNLPNKDNFEIYAVNQIKVFEKSGCNLSDKEKEYLKDNSIFHIGDLIGKRISDNKLVCFEIKTSKRDYWLSGKGQFEENCIAKKSGINIFYILNNYEKGEIKIENINDLWYNSHINVNLDVDKIHQPINLIKKQEAIDKKKEYYSNTFVLFEMVKALKHRELAMLNHRIDIERKNIRYLLAFNIDYLKKHFKRFDFDKSLTNLYMSVSLFNQNVPVFSYNLKERRKDEKYQEFNKNYKKYVKGYNLFIDIDSDWDWKTALKETLQIKELFDEYKLPYFILNSSFKGFHIHIPAEYMPEMEIDELLIKINEVVYNIKGIYDIKSIDMSIFDLKRICKLPYSYVQDGSICLPLSDKQLASFHPNLVKMENVMKNIKLKERGLLLRTHNLSFEELKINVSKFIEDFK
jgi:hypothetical protein